ncbi:hypothetical protein RND81_11G189600 [Saponaria officinalis]|uniref:Uncharacterized protein n=1 Tax=Saponaria officinalis TaxID=3572 RepID=A0AAW1HNT1_SAPOF
MYYPSSLSLSSTSTATSRKGRWVDLHNPQKKKKNSDNGTKTADHEVFRLAKHGTRLHKNILKLEDIQRDKAVEINCKYSSSFESIMKFLDSNHPLILYLFGAILTPKKESSENKSYPCT